MGRGEPHSPKLPRTHEMNVQDAVLSPYLHLLLIRRSSKSADLRGQAALGSPAVNMRTAVAPSEHCELALSGLR